LGNLVVDGEYYATYKSMTRLRRLVTCLLPRRLVFCSGPVRVGGCGGQSGNGASSSQSTSVLPWEYHSPKNPSSFICLSPTVCNGGRCQSR